MSGSIIGSIILWLIAAIVIIAVVVYLLHWLYHRSSKEVAFVRTGFGGEKVVINGGALVLPIIHEVTSVNLNVVRIPVARTREEAVITRDRMRADIEADFFVRVVQKPEAVAAAASTLGSRTMDPDALGELLSGRFVGALKACAAEMSLDEMHEKRADLMTAVAQRAAEALAKNGLEMESVAITDLDQTDLDHFNPSNRFDAEGLTQLIDQIETRRKVRNDIEQSAMVAIRTRNLEAEKETLKLEQESESSRLDQERALEAMRAAQRAEIQQTRAVREAEAEQARLASERQTRGFEIDQRRGLQEAEILAQREIEQARILQEQTLESARIERERLLRAEQIRQRQETEAAEITAAEDVERTRIVSDRQLREARVTAEGEVEAREIQRMEHTETARIAAQKATETARIAQEQVLEKARIDREAQVRTQQVAQRQGVEEAEISAREEVERARIAADRGLDEARILQERDLKTLAVQREMALQLAEIERQIAVLQKRSEEAGAQVALEDARAKAVAAGEKVATIRETEVARRIAAVDRLIAEKNADTARIAAEAEKVTAAVAAEALRLHHEAENILSEDARAASLRSRMLDRLEGIVRESVRPLQNIDGIKILHVGGLTGTGGGGPRSPTDEVIESALRYRAQAPLIDEMMKDIGIENAGVARMGDIFRSARDAQGLAKEATKDRPADKKGS